MLPLKSAKAMRIRAERDLTQVVAPCVKRARALVLVMIGSMSALSAFASSASPAGETADLAWLRDGRVEHRILIAAGAKPSGATPAVSSTSVDDKVPLGSLWKLFVYAYLSDTHANEAAYVCAANHAVEREEDRYCCEPGESVARDLALSRSCAPYFSLARLGVSQVSWQAHWASTTKFPWLLDPARLQPDTQVPVGELLQAMDALPPQAKNEARAAMLRTSVEGYGREARSAIGTGIRYKTYSWHKRKPNGAEYAYGGAAGWLADGTPFWFGARGSSRVALTQWSAQLAKNLPAPQWNKVSDSGCVDVDFFERYPIRAVYPARDGLSAHSEKALGPGQLNGNYRVNFQNGNWIDVRAHGEMNLNLDPQGVPQLSARIPINEYVARVVEREGTTEPVQAARALAIVARSYLIQNGHFESGCWRIADASRTQRVLPASPSPAALDVAWFSDQMVLTGVQVNFHADSAALNRMSWKDAVVSARQGKDFEAILDHAFPHASLGTLSGREECQRMDAAEQWLQTASGQWRRQLARIQGYEAPDSTLKVCMLGEGNPYSDQKRLRIYVRGWRSMEDRITLAHEYLHLALRFHPNGADEEYVEHLARQLIQG